MTKHSAGILLFRRKTDQTEVLLAHPGGPFWANKDEGAWSIPKGEFDLSEEPLLAAKREFAEELGSPAPESEYQDLGEAKTKSDKVIRIFASEADFETDKINSNQFDMEWPPKSGQMQAFPEIDRAEWFELSTALSKINANQAEFIKRLGDYISTTFQPHRGRAFMTGREEADRSD